MIQHVDGRRQSVAVALEMDAVVIVDGCPSNVIPQAVHLDGERQFVTDERIRRRVAIDRRRRQRRSAAARLEPEAERIDVGRPGHLQVRQGQFDDVTHRLRGTHRQCLGLS